MSTREGRADRATHTTACRTTTWPQLLVGFVVVYGVLAVGTALDSTARLGLLTLAAVLVAAACTERLQTRAAGAEIRARLGLGRPGVVALLAATAVSLLVLAVHPVTAALTGNPVTLRPDWPWLLVGAFAVHGLAEELVWRGFLFRRLRADHAFWPAVWWSVPFIAAAHVPIVLTAGPVVGLGAVLVAAVTSAPLSYLYEWGRRTLWAPALVHTAIDSFKVVDVPPGATTSFSLSLIAVSLAAPLLVFLLPRGQAGGTALLRPPSRRPRDDDHPLTRRSRHRDR
ncbi:CPBP family intramembrane glutamic endopeptidase [Geodermatophilus sp. CPCC 206100]|uniref:CPBP family intramembrane glutamic endopeptidase n=1 Tax=Geodermatophilus sp. CPCC 206100 TaxID=3020054 RepID=UPI003B00A7C3